MTVYSASSPGQPVTAPLEAAMNPSQAQPSKLPWQQILNEGAIPILLGLVGYHSAPGGRTLEGPAPMVATSAAPRAAVRPSPFAEPKGPFDETVMMPARTADAPTHD